jgi:hypothetical protein
MTAIDISTDPIAAALRDEDLVRGPGPLSPASL